MENANKKAKVDASADSGTDTDKASSSGKKSVPGPSSIQTKSKPLGPMAKALLSTMASTSASNGSNSSSKGRSAIHYIQRELYEFSGMDDKDILIAPEDGDKLTVLKAVILGPSNSPYAFGFFHFRAEYPHDYPISAPQVKITTTEGGRTRFNPNLYSDGKVCLSILGTWRGEAGEQWSSAQSTYTVLRSIQSLLHDNPYVNEPGYERMDRADARNMAELYKLKLAHETMRVAVCGVMEDIMRNVDDENSSHTFALIIKSWFLYYYDIYLTRCTEALKDTRCAEGTPFTRMQFEGEGNIADGKFQYNALIQRLKNIKKSLDEEEQRWIEEGKTLTAEKASCAQHLGYELVKLEQDPPEGISASPEDPKANMFVWNASIFDGLGQYDGGCFQLRLVFSKKYPEEPPRIKFLSPITHPHITKTDYRPRLGFRLPAPRQPVSIMNILKECQELLRHKPIPEPQIIVNPDAYQLYIDDPPAYKKSINVAVARSQEV